MLSAGLRTERRAQPESTASYVVSVRHLAEAGENVSDDESGVGLTITFAGFLSTVRYLPAVALAWCLFL